MIHGLQVTTSLVNCLLWVIQPGQLSLSSIRSGDYGGGDH